MTDLAPSGKSDENSPVLSKHQWPTLRKALPRGEIDKLVLIEPGYGELEIDARRIGLWRPWR